MVGSKGIVIIESNRCKGCGLCIIGCPLQLLQLEPETVNIKGYHPAAVSDLKHCTGCCNCAVMCPESAITVKRETKKQRRVNHA